MQQKVVEIQKRHAVGAGLQRFVAGVDAGHLGRVERDVAAHLGDGGGVVLRADQRRLRPFDLACQVAHVVGADLQPGPAGGLGDDGELAVQQLPAGVTDHPRPEVLQLTTGRGVKRHRLHRAGAGPVVQRAQPATHFAGCALGERHCQHLARGDMSRRHQVCDAPGDRPGLAGARTGKHAHRTTRGQHRLALLVIELIEMRGRSSSLLACAAASTDMGYIMAGLHRHCAGP